MLEFLEDFDFLETAESIYDPNTGTQILREIGRTNRQLNVLHEQLKKANNTHKASLQLQISEIEKKEEQKFYKAFSYFLSQIVDQFSKIEDITVLNYFMEKYYQKVKDNLITSNDSLDEIHDKLFTKEALDKLEENRQRSISKLEEYSNSDIKKIDHLIESYKQDSRESLNVQKEEYVPQKIKQKRKKKTSRYISIYFLGLLILFFLFSLTIESNTTEALAKLAALILFIFLFSRLSKKNGDWLRNYPEYIKEIETLRQAEKDKKEQAENNYKEKVKVAKEKLLQHPMYDALKSIKTNHSTFEKHKNSILQLENDFYKRWMKTL